MNLNKSTVLDCSIIDISKIQNKAGNITVVENDQSIPFEVKRIYYLYDVPGGEDRGGHAHYELEQYNKSIKYLEQSHILQEQIQLGGELKLWTKTYLFLSFKKLKKIYQKEEIYNLVKSANNIEYNLNFAIYELTDDKLFLQTAYTQIQDNIDSINNKLIDKFLNYPIPKAIIEPVPFGRSVFANS